MKKIGIIGSGEVGKTLALGFEKHGYPVMIGSRTPSKFSEWQKSSGYKGQIGDFNQTAEFGDIIVLAVKGNVALEAMKSISTLVIGKTVIDTTNPIDDSKAPENGVLNYFTSGGKSLIEVLQSELPNANFVKAFNSIGSNFMVNPDFNGQVPTMFICGNNDSAKKEVSEICTKFGFETEDMGSSKSGSVIESLCILWCLPGMLNNQWSHAFKLLKK